MKLANIVEDMLPTGLEVSAEEGKRVKIVYGVFNDEEGFALVDEDQYQDSLCFFMFDGEREEITVTTLGVQWLQALSIENRSLWSKICVLLYRVFWAPLATIKS